MLQERESILDDLRLNGPSSNPLQCVIKYVMFPHSMIVSYYVIGECQFFMLMCSQQACVCSSKFDHKKFMRMTFLRLKIGEA